MFQNAGNFEAIKKECYKHDHSINVEKIGLITLLYKLIKFPHNVLLTTFKMRSEAMSPESLI